MELTYDEEADAAYLTLGGPIEPGEAVQQVGFIETPNGGSRVMLDFDAEGRLLGVEILGASRGLRAQVLEAAVRSSR